MSQVSDLSWVNGFVETPRRSGQSSDEHHHHKDNSAVIYSQHQDVFTVIMDPKHHKDTVICTQFQTKDHSLIELLGKLITCLSFLKGKHFPKVTTWKHVWQHSWPSIWRCDMRKKVLCLVWMFHLTHIVFWSSVLKTRHRV